MATLLSGDAVLFHEVQGFGPDLVLLHPFPLNHHFWDGIVPALSARYRLITPDLRGHGDSELGDGPATMAKHAADLKRLCDAENISKAIFVGVSIGGYVLFEFWRQHRDLVSELVLSNTRAGAETEEGRANRLSAADEVLRSGTADFIESMLARLLGATTRATRPDIVDAARTMMQSMSAEDIAGVQRGMAERPDSIETLSTIDVPTLIIAGEEDIPPLSAAELMRDRISDSKLQIIRGAGHYAAMERPHEYAQALVQNFEAHARRST
jgi:pimeloyl-ACP methyl ester carboxylesterase